MVLGNRIAAIAAFFLAVVAVYFLMRTESPPPIAVPIQAPTEAEARPAGPPNIVWVLLDACRSDHLSCYGYDRATSPVIDGLAKTGVLFENNYAQGLWTKLSVPAFMTGRFFPVSCLDFGGGENVPRVVPPDEKLLPEILRDNGYDTVCVSAHPYISPRSRLYQAFENSTLVPSPDQFPSPSLALMLPSIEAELDKRAHPSAPVFLYVHTMDTHFPHRGGDWAASGYESANIKNGTPVSKSGGRFTPEDQACLRGLHDSSIRQADEAIGSLKTLLAQRGLEKNTLFVISSDHGDLLGEDGTTWGHETIADPVLRTPLILSGPGLPAGRRVAGLTRCVDILPTLLDLAGLKGGTAMQGVSLTPLIRGEKAETGEPVFSRAGVYETGGVFMLIDREHRYEHDVEKNTERFVPAGASAGHEAVSLSEEAAGKYRTTLESRVLPLWNAYTALPCLYRHFDFSKQFDPAWAAPAEAVATIAEATPGAADTTDNRWTFAGGTFWAANWAEQPPPLTLTLDVDPGRYQVSVWLNGTPDLLGHAGSSVRVEVMGAPPAEAVWTASQPTAFPVYSFDVAEVEVPDGHCRITLRPGNRDHWSAVSGIGFIHIGGKTDQGGGISGAENREQLKTLGYVN